MKINLKQTISISVIVILLSLTVVAVIDAASNLTPPAAPDTSEGGGTMKTLTDIYNRITTGADAELHNLNPLAGPAGTMWTLDDIYNAVPANDQVCEGINAGTATCGGTADLVWSDEVSSLCWDTDPNSEWNTEDEGGPFCTDLGGWQTTPLGTLVGAVEYCQYLNEAGTALTDTIGIWSLPTESQLLAGLSDQFILGLPTQTGFQDGTYYWSGSEGDSSSAWLASYNDGYVNSLNDNKYFQDFSFRCIH